MVAYYYDPNKNEAYSLGCLILQILLDICHSEIGKLELNDPKEGEKNTAEVLKKVEVENSKIAEVVARLLKHDPK
jgi:hypothetical protein